MLGDFERTRTVLTSDAFDQSVSNDVLLATGVERAGSLDLDRAEDVSGAEAAVSAVEAMQKALTRAMALWIALASVVALI